MIILLASLLIFLLGYFLYGKFLVRLFEVEKEKDTPAFANYDGVDYVPAKNWFMLYGHHFASISGAGPIIGPVFAAMVWGWFPALLWIVIGSVLFGGVHDFGSLIVSVKEGGSSVVDLTGKVISKRAKIIFSLFVWLALILIIAVFAYLSAETFIKQPKIVLPSLGLIPIAMIAGYLLYAKRANTILVTFFGLVCLVVLMVIGNTHPIHASFNFWMLALFIYCFFASILPVNVLLQPRDYLSSFLLFFGVGVGLIGLFLIRPTVTMPAYIRGGSSVGPMWPSLFVIVACGAISGFHSLIASGTSSKQIASQRHARRIGYGAMLVEGLVAVLAVITVAIMFGPNDDFADALKHTGPIGIFARGYGFLARPMLAGYGTIIAIAILNTFILTTLDTATRVSRYLTEELFKIKNRFVSTFLIVGFAAALAYSGQWNKIWPVFGAANQLVAALALFVISCWLAAKKRPNFVTLLPALFMFITTVAALIFQAMKYAAGNDIILLVVTVVLMVLALIMAVEILLRVCRRKQDVVSVDTKKT
ncbi:MAG: carbon starvation protein A [Candidatus Omnitrophota bacterium]|nr:carbon starvation protein A [Candidatus Omnitrophota bacterium]